LAFWPCYSYSDPYTYGSTNNAAATGTTWGMTSGALGVPVVPGMDINGVIYRYTTTKNPDDPFTVTIQNEDASGAGYIFRETDDWSGLPGNTIRKYVPVELTPIARWGTGSIVTEGEGQIDGATVVYTYRLDECFNAEVTPGCPGYIDPTQFQFALPDYELYDALSDQYVLGVLAPTDPSLYEEEEKDESIEKDEEKATKDDFEKGLAATQNALTLANNISQGAILSAMNASVNMSTYYGVRMDGRAYPEATRLNDSQLPENRNGLRNGLAQQLLHDQMVDMQYK
jgi:hypothetical protein